MLNTEALVTGTELFLAGGLGLYRVLLLEPSMGHYPNAGLWTRAGIYIFSSCCAVIAFQLYCVGFSGILTVPPGPQSKLQFFVHGVLIYKICMTANLLRQRYPLEVWRRLNRIHSIVRLSCVR